MQVTRWRRINAHRDHRWAQSRISAYVDGELRPRQQRRLAAHEEICPDCRRVVRTLRGMVARLRSLSAPGPPRRERVADRVAARIAAGG